MPKTGQSPADRKAYVAAKSSNAIGDIAASSPDGELKDDMKRRMFARQRVTFGDMIDRSVEETHAKIKARKK